MQTLQPAAQQGAAAVQQRQPAARQQRPPQQNWHTQQCVAARRGEQPAAARSTATTLARQVAGPARSTAATVLCQPLGCPPNLLAQPPSTLLAPPEPLCATALGTDRQAAEQQERYANVGAAIRSLHSDLPALLERAPQLEHYADSVSFEDRISPRLGLPAASCSGKDAYSRLMWSLRFHRALFFCKSRLEVVRMWEREPGVVSVRWSARASPRLLDGLVATSNTTLTLEGVSDFYFGEQSGLITRHVADCVSYSGMQLQMPLLARRYARTQQGALVPGLAGGSLDDC